MIVYYSMYDGSTSAGRLRKAPLRKGDRRDLCTREASGAPTPVEPSTIICANISTTTESLHPIKTGHLLLRQAAMFFGMGRIVIPSGVFWFSIYR